MKKISLLTLSVLASLVLGCVKDRPITYIPDPDRDLMEKQSFTGANESPAFWAYKVTVDKTSGSGFTFTGFQSEMKVGYFDFTRDQLRFLNANVNYTDTNNIQLSPEVLNEWSVTHSDRRLAEQDGYTTNREEENNYLGWDKKRFFKVDWEKANISEAASFPFTVDFASTYMCWTKRSSELLDDSREITDEHISFVIRVDYQQNSICTYVYGDLRRQARGDFTFSVDYKYSFKRIPKEGSPTYRPFKYSGEDDLLEKKYGYFQTVLEGRAEDNRYENTFFMNRWDPTKKHDIYFAPDFPEKYKPVFYETICHANRLFARNGLSNYPIVEQSCRELADAEGNPLKDMTCTSGLCFDLKENDGSKKFGDLRYSFFKIIEDLERGPFGYGPSDANPFTGEIISANTMIWTGFLKYYLNVLKMNSEREQETIPVVGEDGNVAVDENGNVKYAPNPNYRYSSSTLFNKMKLHHLGSNISDWTSTSRYLDVNSQTRPEFEYLLSQMTYGYPGWNAFTSHKNFPGLMDNPQSFQAPKYDERLFKLSSFEDIQSSARALNLPDIDIMSDRLSKAKAIAEDYLLGESYGIRSPRDSLVYPYSEVLVNASGMFALNLSAEEIERRIMVQVALHEFGHNLGLRHNFYGSVDEKNFRKSADGSYQSKSSSVMEYLDMRDEVVGLPEYEAYDEAALVYAYSNGSKDISREKNTLYLYCTDEHAILNALCNRHDSGTTPSEIIKSMIERYDERYFLMNKRFDRAYWDTSQYYSYVFSTMHSMKKVLMMWRTSMRESYISKKLDSSGKSYGPDKKMQILEDIETDLRQAIKLTIAFYDSVLQQESSERSWLSKYNEQSGAVEEIGILYDKVFAMLFLMGDDPILYNPNHYLGKASFVTYLNDYGYKEMVDKILENSLSVRPDMEPWFFGFAKMLYARNATNVYNLSDNALVEKIAFRCYTPGGFQSRFGMDVSNYVHEGSSKTDILDTDLIPMEQFANEVTDPYFKDNNGYLGVTKYNGNYFVASSVKNPYAYSMIEIMVRGTLKNEDSAGLAKSDIYQSYLMYNYFLNSVIPQQCDDGGSYAPRSVSVPRASEPAPALTPVTASGI